ncbi:MAG: hypothetical protein KIT33_00935 [Candidatus Kapabacteria bacterium]|nr:hypothetical protein [Ignavibacteriota bacterium]MCW5883512.1 hypothetical protein [Candidatus Kapabacteria bacterium]
MNVAVDKINLRKSNKSLSDKPEKSDKSGNLSKHFGKLRRNIDGLKYQQEVRANEN